MALSKTVNRSAAVARAVFPQGRGARGDRGAGRVLMSDAVSQRAGAPKIKGKVRAASAKGHRPDAQRCRDPACQQQACNDRQRKRDPIPGKVHQDRDCSVRVPSECHASLRIAGLITGFGMRAEPGRIVAPWCRHRGICRQRSDRLAARGCSAAALCTASVVRAARCDRRFCIGVTRRKKERATRGGDERAMPWTGTSCESSTLLPMPGA